MNIEHKTDIEITKVLIDGLFYRKRRTEGPFPTSADPLRFLPGENGRGKTTIFNMLRSIFEDDDDFKRLASTPFSALTLLWNDNSELHFIRELAPDRMWAEIRVALRRPYEPEGWSGSRPDYLSGTHRLPYPESPIETRETRDFKRTLAAEQAGDLSEVEAALLADENDRISIARETREESEVPSRSTAESRNSRPRRKISRARDANYIEPAEEMHLEIAEFLAKVRIDFIGIDRVMPLSDQEPSHSETRSSRGQTVSDRESPVDEVSSRIKRLLWNCEAEPLDASDLVKIMSREQESSSHEPDTLRQQLSGLISRCDELIRFEIDVYKLRNNLRGLESVLTADAPERMLLAFHFALVETERRIFELEQTKKRVEDFLSVINNLFRDKKLIMDSGRLTVVSDAGSSYPLTALSSGEQHLIVLLGRVLFPVDRYSMLRRKDAVRIVLLDEPEISLHLRWQFAVRDALQRFSENGRHRVFVATHSLHIVSNLENLEYDLSAEN